MIGFMITNLISEETSFQVNGQLGQWNFERSPNYYELVPHILNDGACGNTFMATLSSVSNRSSDADFSKCCDEIIDICLLLSFIQARCITVSGSSPASDISFVTLGDSFIRARGIVGFPSLSPSSNMTDLFADWNSMLFPTINNKNLRLFFSHYLSGLTCFSMEDLFLSLGVQMDLVKQEENRLMGKKHTYQEGMESASARYAIPKLSSDYKKMRNDIVHSGVLSGTNFKNKSKSDCAEVIVDTLNWIDQYVMTSLNIQHKVNGFPRWKQRNMEFSLPSITVR